MSRTPSRRSSRNKSISGTPGSESSVRTTASSGSTGSYKPGLPWHTLKELAKDIELAYPLANGQSVVALLNSGGHQPLANFLNELVKKDPSKAELYGLPGSTLRGKIGDVIQYWKKKSADNYARTVLLKYQLKQVPASKQRKQIPTPKKQTPTPKKQDTLREQEVSFDLSSASEEESPTKPPAIDIPKNIHVKQKQGSTMSKPLIELAPESVARAAGVDFVRTYLASCVCCCCSCDLTLVFWLQWMFM